MNDKRRYPISDLNYNVIGTAMELEGEDAYTHTLRRIMLL